MAQYKVFFSPSAAKVLHKLPEAVQKRIAAAAKELRDNPRPRGCVKLEGADDLWRIRVGDYRIVYTIEDDELIVLVVRLAHGKDVYRRYIWRKKKGNSSRNQQFTTGGSSPLRSPDICQTSITSTWFSRASSKVAPWVASPIQIVASVSHDNLILLWDAASGDKLGSLKGHDKDVRGLAFHPNGVHFASGAVEKTVRLWNWNESLYLPSPMYFFRIWASIGLGDFRGIWFDVVIPTFQNGCSAIRYH